MFNPSIIDQLIQALSRFQQALQGHDHPNLALQDHTHQEYFLIANSKSEPVENIVINNNLANVDLSLSTRFILPMIDLATLAIVGTPVNAGATISILIIQNNTTPQTLTYPANFKWEGGVPVDISTTLNAVDLLVLTTFDGGVTWHANISKDRS